MKIRLPTIMIRRSGTTGKKIESRFIAKIRAVRYYVS